MLLVLAVIPTDPSLSMGSLDKIGHLCEYLVFAWLLVQALPPTWRPVLGCWPRTVSPIASVEASRLRAAKLVGGQAIWATRLPAPARFASQSEAAGAQAGTREREYLLGARPHTNRGASPGVAAIGVGAWLYATSYGGLMELLQVALPWRGADWTDALMNALGAALGAWLGTRWPSPQRDIA